MAQLLPPAPPEPTIIEVRGQQYKRNYYDWYIDQALMLAPDHWTYEQVVRLRYAIRENYQHAHNIPVVQLGVYGGETALEAFIETIEGLEGCHYE